MDEGDMAVQAFALATANNLLLNAITTALPEEALTAPLPFSTQP